MPFVHPMLQLLTPQNMAQSNVHMSAILVGSQWEMFAMSTDEQTGQMFAFRNDRGQILRITGMVMQGPPSEQERVEPPVESLVEMSEEADEADRLDEERVEPPVEMSEEANEEDRLDESG